MPRLSYDQRPGKLRVVQDKGGNGGPRNGDMSAEAKADAPAALAEAAKAPGSATEPAETGGGLPLLGAALFVLACAGGGVAIAVIRPFGLG